MKTLRVTVRYRNYNANDETKVTIDISDPKEGIAETHKSRSEAMEVIGMTDYRITTTLFEDERPTKTIVEKSGEYLDD